MSLYSKKFIKFLNEQDEEQLTDPEAMQSTLEPETDAGDFDIDMPETADGSPVNSQQREMFDELSEWIVKMDDFSDYLNGTTDSIQTSLNSAEADTIFDSISNSETKKIARVAMEVSSLSEILKGYLAGANDPKYRFN
jgi:hypothetical protein